MIELSPLLPVDKIAIAEIIIDDVRAQKPIEVIQEKWRVANMWVIKLGYSNSIKIPYRYSPYKSLGLFAYNLFLVCKEVYFINGNKRFNNGAEWFNHALIELCLIEVNECLKGIKIIENSWKKSFIDSESRKLAKLKSLEENPYSLYPDYKAISELINLASHLATTSDVFFKKYWKPFLKSYSTYINDLKKHPEIKHGYIDKEGDYILQIGNGKSPASRIKISH